MLTALVFSTFLQIGSCLKSEGHNSTCCSKFWIAGDIQQVSHEGQDAPVSVLGAPRDSKKEGKDFLLWKNA